MKRKTQVDDKTEVDDLTIARFCLNPECPSVKGRVTGRYLGRCKIGQTAIFLCPDCGQRTVFNPPQREETAVVLDGEE